MFIAAFIMRACASVRVHVCVCVWCIRVCVHVHVSMCVCVRVCTHGCVNESDNESFWEKNSASNSQ